MPFVSTKQRGYFFAHRKKLESQGVNVGEWASASKGMQLPERAMHRKKVDLGSKGSFEEKPGALHSMLHVPQGQKLTASEIKPHSGDSPLLRRRKASAAGFKAMHKG